MQTVHTAGPEVVHDRSHVTWIRSELTRCNAARFEAMREEMAVALDEQIPLSAGGLVDCIQQTRFLIRHGSQNGRRTRWRRSSRTSSAR